VLREKFKIDSSEQFFESRPLTRVRDPPNLVIFLRFFKI